jgi:hypothetical protein
MFRGLCFILLAWPVLFHRLAAADDEGPPISITSPDAGTTFAFGTIKSHVLFWNQSEKVLVARVTFTDIEENLGDSNDDTHEFRLPGITFDQGRGVFLATTAKGETIPVARIHKTLFLKSIEVLPNARIRILHPRGVITVVLEAISPNDPAIHAAPGSSDPSAGHPVDIPHILN